MINKRFTVLYAEDDDALAFVTKDSLEGNGFEVLHCKTGDKALETFKQQHCDICVLDIMMPGMDGFELAKTIRSLNNEVPIIFLSAKTLKEDRIKGLKTGADDYLVKPFSIEELVLKIEIFLTRSKKNSVPGKTYSVGSYTFDYSNFSLIHQEETQLLTSREAELLYYLIQHQDKVVKREEILVAIWGKDDYFLGRSMDVFISRLRKLLRFDSNISIENLHGIGFKFSVKK